MIGRVGSWSVLISQPTLCKPYLLFLCLCLCIIGGAKGQRAQDDDLSKIPLKTPSFAQQMWDSVLGLNGASQLSTSTVTTQSAGLSYDSSSTGSLSESLPALLDALQVMQTQFFEIWLGKWPEAIDWTAAVMGTQVSATLKAITQMSDPESTRGYTTCPDFLANATIYENLINQYFTHLLSFYFNENTLALRGQAFDDMLWVVLGWLEAISLINLHSDIHYTFAGDQKHASPWYAKQFVPIFAHRVRIFYELAAEGWDTSLCGGGMIWSPYLAPYKNAITNQLYISASVNMYLSFPGDDNTSPFVVGEQSQSDGRTPPGKVHDPQHLEAAVEAYRWLKASNMTNTMGLYVDGFHVHGWRGGNNGSIGSGQCDIREEKVYTYNQGVLLSGLRGLWEATGTQIYLEDGHELIRNVIAATGWYNQAIDDSWKWAGIGRNGVLEETCDTRGSCNQDGQTFKGIFFHHLTAFCAPLEVGEKSGVFFRADKGLANLHKQSCQEYGPWIRHNAEAAYGTRDHRGRYGMWWTFGLWHQDHMTDHVEAPDDGTDYRNHGIPRNELWRLPDDKALRSAENADLKVDPPSLDGVRALVDPNSRGRGRTVETQSGGVGVVRALFRLVDQTRR